MENPLSPPVALGAVGTDEIFAGSALTADKSLLTYVPVYAALKQYGTNLAKAGSPDSLTEPRWPRFDGTSQQMLSLVPPRAQVENGFAAEHHCSFWVLAS